MDLWEEARRCVWRASMAKAEGYPEEAKLWLDMTRAWRSAAKAERELKKLQKAKTPQL